MTQTSYPSPPVPKNLLKNIREIPDVQERLKAYHAAVTTHPDDPFLVTAYARTLLMLKRPEDACVLLNDAFAAYPEQMLSDSPFAETRVLGALRSGRAAEAVRIAEEFIERYPENAQENPHFVAAYIDAMNTRGDHAKAAAWVDEHLTPEEQARISHLAITISVVFDKIGAYERALNVVLESVGHAAGGSPTAIYKALHRACKIAAPIGQLDRVGPAIQGLDTSLLNDNPQMSALRLRWAFASKGDDVTRPYAVQHFDAHEPKPITLGVCFCLFSAAVMNDVLRQANIADTAPLVVAGKRLAAVYQESRLAVFDARRFANA